jgi:transcriptional regulator
MNGEALKGHLDLLLLAALRASPAHGYAIAETLRRRSEGTFDLAEGTLYPALHRLEASGLLASKWSEESGRRRRIYHVTQKGQRVLGARQDEWSQFARAVQGVLEGT